MEQLWDIALKAQNTDVSLNAIHYLNNHYINGELLHSAFLVLNISPQCIPVHSADTATLAEREDEFVNHCMDSLYKAVTCLDKVRLLILLCDGHWVSLDISLLQSPECSLLVIQRGLILLTNHLESFRKRHAFHLRMWQLEGSGITSHQKSLQDSQSCALRVMLQPAGAAEKVSLSLCPFEWLEFTRAQCFSCAVLER